MYSHEPLPTTHHQQHHYALMCHKNESDRIRDAMLQSADCWFDLSNNDVTSSNASTPESKDDKRCIIVSLPELKGRRKDRQGYICLVILRGAMSPAHLVPMARRQISWAGLLSHRTFCDVPEENATSSARETAPNNFHSIIKSAGLELWRQLLHLHGFNCDVDFLRIDVQPKTFNAEACNALQCAAATGDISADSISGSREDGPIKLTHSATNAKFIVTIVVCPFSPNSNEQSHQTQKYNIYWGISNSNQHWNDLNQRMNDNATKEIILKTTDSVTGLDISKEIAAPEIPVSRAYYKLAQVFNDIDNLKMISCLRDSNAGDIHVEKLLSHASGLDIGASPGGWTQVMHTKLKMPTIAAVDPGVLAHRVETMSGVHHIREDISSKEAIQCLAMCAPFSLIVCDACVDVAVLFEKIVKAVEGCSSILESSRRLFAWPLCLVLTLKFPYKSNGSIDRHVNRAKETITAFLREIARIGRISDRNELALEVKYKICHLFANSVAERCLVALFYEKK